MPGDDGPGGDRQPGAELVFVVGARRSGTYWLQRILTSHPRVDGVPSETYLFSDGVATLLRRLHNGARSSPQVGAVHADRGAVIRGLRGLCDEVLRPYLQPRSRYLVERTPDHVHHIALISEVYPGARFVHIVRDGRDVVRSLLAKPWGPDNVEAAASEWRDSVRAGRLQAPPATHYRELRYEELLTQPEAAIGSLFGWLGLDADEIIMGQALGEARTALSVDATRPVPRLEKWKGALRPRDLAAFERVAGDLRAELGYEPVSSLAWYRRRAAGPRRLAARSLSWADDGLRHAPRRLLARLAGPRPAPGPSPSQRQAAVDALLAALQAGEGDAIEAALSPDALITIVGREGSASMRGAPGRAALVDAVRSDSAFRGRQVIGDVHPAIPTTSVVLSFETEDGDRCERVLAISLRGMLCERLTLYQLPLSTKASPAPPRERAQR